MRWLRITAPSRLHFGLIAAGVGPGRRYGGAGVMIAPPSLELQLKPAEAFSAIGPAADRVREFAQRWSVFQGRESLPLCRISVERLPAMHAGLGVGTQLGLSVAKILNAFEGVETEVPAMLAASVGRGERSAVGTYGFFGGGLIAEQGKKKSDGLAPLEDRVALPPAWRWVLVRPENAAGLSGDAERQVFSTLQAPQPASGDTLRHLLQHRLLPAARAGDFDSFSRALYEFGYQSGMSFAPIQGGPYNGPRLANLVTSIRSLGAIGVGQSSWGPTLFALCENADRAAELVAELRPQADGAELLIAETAAHGAELEHE